MCTIETTETHFSTATHTIPLFWWPGRQQSFIHHAFCRKYSTFEAERWTSSCFPYAIAHNLLTGLFNVEKPRYLPVLYQDHHRRRCLFSAWIFIELESKLEYFGCSNVWNMTTVWLFPKQRPFQSGFPQPIPSAVGFFGEKFYMIWLWLCASTRDRIFCVEWLLSQSKYTYHRQHAHMGWHKFQPKCYHTRLQYFNRRQQTSTRIHIHSNKSIKFMSHHGMG